MRKALNATDLDKVCGGTAIVSDQGVVGFSSSKEMYYLNLGGAVTWKTVRNYVEELQEANSSMSDAAFDSYAKSMLIEKGWLGAAY